jgi:drug/metabolite transporter (DMT)-like permease
VNLAAAAALLTLSLLLGEPWFTGGYANKPEWQGLTPMSFVWFGLLALVPHLLGHGAANYAVRHLPATVVNVATLGEPILATALAVPIFGEWPSSPAVFAAGAAILLGGLYLAATAPAKES